MSKNLSELQRLLIEGQRRSRQGSYRRRQSAPEAISFLLEARSGLKDYVDVHMDEAQAWRLLSQAEECLLNYAAARHSLQKAMSLAERKNKKDLKRLALLKECESQWADLRLTPTQLAQLGSHLRARLSENQCDHTLQFTDEWLKTTGVLNLKGVMDALRNRGGYCDCEVLNNVVA